MSKKSVKAPPGARRLIESLQDLGYDTTTAIADLVDNSIVAGATEVFVDIRHKSSKQPAAIIISDNGKGMTSEQLHNGMRFGAFQDYSIDDLGKYGLGLKTASLSQCGLLTVGSRARGSRSRISIAQWDISHIKKIDEWDLLTPDLSDLPKWKQEIIESAIGESHGTVVIWTELEEALPLLESSKEKTGEAEVARLMSEVSDHLRMVFHRFMEGSVREHHKLSISVCGPTLEPWDPFCKSEKATKPLQIEKEEIVATRGDEKGKKHKVLLQPYVLPRQDEFSSREAHKEAAGPKTWNPQQGFYFYRNNRLIQSGGWSNIRSIDEHGKLLRIAVDFNAGLDASFAINITKMKAKIPSEIRERVKNLVSRWYSAADAKYRNKPAGSKLKKPAAAAAKIVDTPAVSASSARHQSGIFLGAFALLPSNAPAPNIMVTKGNKPSLIRIVVPKNHPCFEAFNASGKNQEFEQLFYILLGTLEGLVLDQIDPEDIPIDSIKRQLKKVL